jgi:hypothetical protein
MHDAAPWLTLALLGAFHGLNPAMGWLFAVALGLQERRRAAVLGAFGPIALGHAASIAVVVGAMALARAWLTPGLLQVLGGSALLAFGLYKWLRPLSHPRWVGMRVRGRELATWSFLMATAHGAGLMLVPVLLRLQSAGAASAASAASAAPLTHAAHLGHAGHGDQAMLAAAAPRLAELAPIGVHTLAMFAAMGLIALVVYEKVGLAILRRAWFNLDRVWAGALVAAGALTLIL